MNKASLVGFLEKIHLNGLTENVKLSVKNNRLTSPFININGNVVGEVTLNDVDMGDNEFGVMDVGVLLKMLSPMSSDVKIDYHYERKMLIRLLITDGKYVSHCPLINNKLIKQPKTAKMDESIFFNFDSTFISDFLTCRKAVSSSKATFIADGSDIKIILGENNDYSNKMEFSTGMKWEGIPFIPITFDAEILKEILSYNKDMNSGVLFLDEGGCLCLSFTTSATTSKYYIAAFES